jgi:hypothetical protein
MNGVAYLSNAKGTPSLPSDSIWKAFAEQDAVPPPPRTSKPVLITPQKVQCFELVTTSGQTIATSGGPLPYDDGRWRYYFDSYGYVLADRAIAIQGNPVVQVNGGGSTLGTVNPAFRQNDYVDS